MFLCSSYLANISFFENASSCLWQSNAQGRFVMCSAVAKTHNKDKRWHVPALNYDKRCIGIKWPTSQMADGPFGLVSDGQWPFESVSEGLPLAI